MRRKRWRVPGFGLALVGLVVLGLGSTAGADEGTAGASSAKVGATGDEKVVAQESRRRGRRGPRGRRGAAGPPGPVGPPGPGAGKILFRANRGTGLQIPYRSDGLAIEADCGTDFQLRGRSEGGGHVFHALAGSTEGAFGGGFVNSGNNDAIDLLPGNAPQVSGTLNFVSFSGVVLTVSYTAAFGTSQGDCVFGGTVVRAG